MGKFGRQHPAGRGSGTLHRLKWRLVTRLLGIPEVVVRKFERAKKLHVLAWTFACRHTAARWTEL